MNALLEKMDKFVCNPKYRFSVCSVHGFYNWMSDEKYLKKKFKVELGRELDLENPSDFNEKLQWLKLHDRKEYYHKMVDKYEAKKYISEIVGEEYPVPLLGVWDSFQQIDFTSLPNEFVLKTTHDSGGVVICRDKSAFDFDKARKKLSRSLQRNFFNVSREWPYKGVKPRIIAEKYLDERGGVLTDYKIFCFDGVPKIIYVSKDKADDPRTDFFDMDWNYLPIRMRDPGSEILPQKPLCFEKMKEIAEKLSNGHPHLRVDFYQVDGRLYVGELTFYHCGGFQEVRPAEWNKKMGEWIKINK